MNKQKGAKAPFCWQMFRFQFIVLFTKPSPLGKVAKIGSSEPIFDGRGIKYRKTSPAPFGGTLPKGEG